MHLRIEDPEEAKAFGSQGFHGYIYDLLVAHGWILQVELVIRKHETWVVSLGSFDSPWRVDVNDFKMADLINEVLQIEKSQITIYEGLWLEFWGRGFLFLVWFFFLFSLLILSVDSPGLGLYWNL